MQVIIEPQRHGGVLRPTFVRRFFRRTFSFLRILRPGNILANN
nr:MAG TPA: hypothetical protein [Caudoviricetes sp.]